MHRIFKKALDNATGKSESIIVVILDIRGFSPFSQRCESVDVASFLRKVYMKIINDYFPFSSFYKSTGDGLLITIPWDERNLQEISQKVIESCINCHSEFGNICSDDAAINFEVPGKIGIGVTRGSACRLVSGRKTIDYAGHLLNLTARLTDLARPSGIIIDGDFVIELLTRKQRKLFEEDQVYLKGIAEKEPIRIYFTPEFAKITKYNKQPIASKRWREVIKNWSYGYMMKLNPFRFDLPSEPISPDEIEIIVARPKIINGQVSEIYITFFEFDQFEYRLERGNPTVLVDIPALCKYLGKKQVGKEVEITVSVGYAEK